MSIKRILLVLSLVCILVGGAGVSQVLASLADPPKYVVLPGNDPRTHNIEFWMGWGGTTRYAVAGTTYEWKVSGRFALFNTTGDINNALDDNLPIIQNGKDSVLNTDGTEQESGMQGPSGKLGYIKIRVGDVYSIVGETNGAWRSLPHISVYPAGSTINRFGESIQATWVVTGNIACDISVRILGDSVRMQLTLRNESGVAQNVGAAIVTVPAFENNISPLTPFMFGTPLKSFRQASFPFVPGYGVLDTGLWLTKNNIPDELSIYNFVDNPNVVLKYGLGTNEGTKPDYMAIGEAEFLAGPIPSNDFTNTDSTMWIEPTPGNPFGAFTIDPDHVIGNGTFTTQLATFLCWKQQVLAGSTSAARNIVTYMGTTGTDTSSSVTAQNKKSLDSAALSVIAPAIIKYEQIDNSSNNLNPAEFKVQSVIRNLALEPGPFDLINVDMSLILPDTSGLKLKTGEKAVINVGKVPHWTISKSADWDLILTGEYAGLRDYYVTAKDKKTGWTSTVKKQIMIPITGKTKTVTGWQMMSVPFDFPNNSIYHSLGKLPGQVFVNEWITTGWSSGSYLAVTNFTPGKGYWIYFPKDQSGTLELASDKQAVGILGGIQEDPAMLDLKVGWNLISNPFAYPIYMNRLQVYNKQLNEYYSWDKAVGANLVNKALYYYNNDKKAFDVLTSLDSILTPYKSYWVRIRKPIKIIINPMIWPAGGVIVTNN